MILNENLNVKHFYDKNYLVLFGEYIPFRKTLERFGISIADLSQSILDITAGNEHKAIQCDKIPPFNPLICYEAIFPHFIIQEKPAPCWIINLTNDAWFGNTAGPYQHLTICRFRAIEQGVPIIRVANTGISAVIDYKGKILHSLPLNQRGYIDVTVPNKAPSVPPYTIYGENIFYILILAFLIISAFLNRKYVKNLIYSRGF
jgi:apolipoprotein N-acyltransferase